MKLKLDELSMIFSGFGQISHRRIEANSLLWVQYFSNQTGRPSRATSEIYRQARAIYFTALKK
jgi:hypothetical protein